MKICWISELLEEQEREKSLSLIRQETMKQEEIKKILYKEKPIAKEYNRDVVMEGSLHFYKADTSMGRVTFTVPRREMGEEEFAKEIPAQLLIRWLNTRQ